MRRRSSIYPRPKACGGILIRKVIRHLRDFGITLPITSDILIAVSGGADSVALAHLLSKYGRRIVEKSRIHLLYVNHGWRVEGAQQDEALLRSFARKFKVPLQVVRIQPPAKKGVSWEDEARKARMKVFNDELKRLDAAWLLTAHHGDDLAETLLWRLFTGSSSDQGGGILVQAGNQLRPLLGIRKSELIRYLEEEQQTWNEDETNLSERFLRAKMRVRLMPVVEELFPRAIHHLIELGLGLQLNRLQSKNAESRAIFEENYLGTDLLFGMTDARIRRAHLKLLKEKLDHSPHWQGEVKLPGGWRIRRELLKTSDRWVLEKDNSLEMRGNTSAI